jgi:tRNA A-37 threonylcarbamoyl transferase component Bud32
MDTTFTKTVDKNEHENHVYFYAKGIKTSRVFSYKNHKMVTEFICGDTISNHAVDNNTSKAIALNLISEVEKLHSIGYLHCDLNPTNVIIKETDVYLIDFELSSPIDDAVISIKEEMMDLMKLLVIILNNNLKLALDLLSLCKEDISIKLPFSLKYGVTYADIKAVIQNSQ